MTAKVTANNTTNKNRFVFMVNLEGKVKTALLVKVMKEWARCTYQWNVQNTQLLFRNQLYWEPRTVSKLKLFFFLCTSWWCYTVFHPVQLKQPYAECGCILCFFYLGLVYLLFIYL